MTKKYDLIVVGGGAAGIMASIVAARKHAKVLLLEKLSKVGVKLKATGGGKCNISNRLDNEIFMHHFGRDGKFMMPALEAFDHQKLIDFFYEIGVETHAPDGYRIFPVSHNATTIVDALKNEMHRLDIDIICRQRVTGLKYQGSTIAGLTTQTGTYYAKKVIIATGGKGYPTLGAEGDGYSLAVSAGHQITKLFPAMMPLKTKERWVANCRADTIAKVELRINIKKYKKLHAKGDLIFTKNGIRGPVVLDFSREITPLLEQYDEVPVIANFTGGMHEEQINMYFKDYLRKNPSANLLAVMKTLLPESLSLELCRLSDTDPTLTLSRQNGTAKDKLFKLLAWTPLTVCGHDGFQMAMITRGGIVLKEINPYTMESRKVSGLYFCGEVLNLDGPCGGYNLQWSFASGYLAGNSSVSKE
jgi:predicted Rossmann fold flavoprotein